MTQYKNISVALLVFCNLAQIYSNNVENVLNKALLDVRTLLSNNSIPLYLTKNVNSILNIANSQVVSIFDNNCCDCEKTTIFTKMQLTSTTTKLSTLTTTKSAATTTTTTTTSSNVENVLNKALLDVRTLLSSNSIPLYLIKNVNSILSIANSQVVSIFDNNCCDCEKTTIFTKIKLTSTTTKSSTVTTTKSAATTTTTSISRAKPTTTATTTTTTTTTTTKTTTTTITTATTKTTTTTTTTTKTSTITSSTATIKTTTTTIKITTISNNNSTFTFKASNLTNVFTSYSLKLSIKTGIGSSFVALAGFGMLMSSNSTYYYVNDYAGGKIFIYDDNWNFIRYVTFKSPAYMITIGSSLYISCDSYIAVTDGNLNIFNQYFGVGSPLYRGLYYNSTNNLIYVVTRTLYVIYVFNLNLVLNDSFTVLSTLPYSIAGYNDQLYVGTYSGSIFVIVNKKVINSFYACGGYSELVSSFIIDQFGSIASLCTITANFLFLYYSSGNYSGRSLSTAGIGEYIAFDSKGRFIIITDPQISIYY